MLKVFTNIFSSNHSFQNGFVRRQNHIQTIIGIYIFSPKREYKLRLNPMRHKDLRQNQQQHHIQLGKSLLLQIREHQDHLVKGEPFGQFYLQLYRSLHNLNQKYLQRKIGISRRWMRPTTLFACQYCPQSCSFTLNIVPLQMIF